MKRVLVTGATGYLGGYVVEELLCRGVEVIASARTESHASGKTWFNKILFLPLDINKADRKLNLFEYFGKPDVLIHLAWGNLEDFKNSAHVEQQLPNHFAFINQLVGEGLKDITITGTCLEYGMQEGCLQEDMVASPLVTYAIAKDELRKSLQQIGSAKLFSLKWLRLFYMYGKGQQSKSLISQLDKAVAAGEASFNMSGGEQVRDFLPVDKMAKLIVAVALMENASGIINCCSGEPVKVKDFVRNYLSQKKQGIQLNLGYYPYPDYEPMEFWGSDTKLKKYLNNDKSD